MSQRTIEMTWVCSACGTSNLGRHKECQKCGDPKQANEPWLMPGSAPSVVDPTLLAQAKAGADWACHYCTAYNKTTDGACVQCGSPRGEGKRVHEHAPAPVTPARGLGAARAGRRFRWTDAFLIGALVVGFGGIASCLIAGLLGNAVGTSRAPAGDKTRVHAANVVDARWRHEVTFERYRVIEEEGFAETRPGEAFDVRSLGERHHHDEQVLDHMRTETYTEQVPYEETETYTDQEQCGEDCTELPQTCSESCVPDQNGFATCTTSCTGGGRSCSPRYCAVTRTRQVTRHRAETRTREVPVYRAEPRYAEFFHWSVWRWTTDRVVVAEGRAADPPRWPEGSELAPSAPLGEGEDERSRRSAHYEVFLRGDDRERRLPVGEIEGLASYPVGSCWKFVDTAPTPVGPC